MSVPVAASNRHDMASFLDSIHPGQHFQRALDSLGRVIRGEIASGGPCSFIRQGRPDVQALDGPHVVRSNTSLA